VLPPADDASRRVIADDASRDVYADDACVDVNAGDENSVSADDGNGVYSVSVGDREDMCCMSGLLTKEYLLLSSMV
jgi:hypothetical protein